MGLNLLRYRRAARGFLLPVLLLLMSLVGVLVLSVVAETMQSGRTQGATALRRLAFETAEDVISLALRESLQRRAPWNRSGESATGVRWSATVRSLGDWTSASDTTGIPVVEAHERVAVVAITARGATVRLEQDYVRPATNLSGASAMPRRTVWREMEAAP